MPAIPACPPGLAWEILPVFLDNPRVQTTILLAGAGHTHLLAAPALARALDGRARVALVAPSGRLLYSGMMPGWIAGQYRFDDCAIDLRSVSDAAGVEWLEDTLVDVDFRGRRALGASGRGYAYDVISLNVGSANLTGALAADPGVRVLGAKPFAEFVAAWNAVLEQPGQRRCAVIGGGAAAIEIALALAALARGDGPLAGSSVTLVTHGSRLMAGQSHIAGRLASAALAGRGVRAVLGHSYRGVTGRALMLERRNGAEPLAQPIQADLVVVANGARAPDWLTHAARRDGLPVAPDGGVAVDATMRAIGTDGVYASGDCASFVGIHVPKSGVYALRQAPALAATLAARADGDAPGVPYAPQRRSLALLNRCDGSAIGLWGPLGFAGRWVWRWKDRIDRRFIERFR
jgi:selenide,water dikinase/sulfide:quinone oxidoreductase